MARRRRRIIRLLSPAQTKSTDAIVRSVSAALRRDHRQLRSLMQATRSQLDAKGRRRLDRGFESSLTKLREVVGSSRPRGPGDVAVVAATGAKVPRSALRTSRDASTRRALRAARHNGRSIDELATTQRKLATMQRRLAATQRQLAQVVAQLQARGDVALQRGLLDATLRQKHGRKRDRKALHRQGKDLRAQIGKQVSTLEKRSRKLLTTQLRDAQIQKLHTAATSLHTSAFGRLGDPGHPHNLTIAGNHLLWSYFGDIAKRLGIPGFDGEKGWAWLLPAANLATGLGTLGRRQHHRFATGIASGFPDDGTGTSTVTISLEDQVAGVHWDELQRRTDVVSAVSAIEVPLLTMLSSEVVAGSLVITLRGEDPGGSVPTFAGSRVAWVVEVDPFDG